MRGMGAGSRCGIRETLLILSELEQAWRPAHVGKFPAFEYQARPADGIRSADGTSAQELLFEC